MTNSSDYWGSHIPKDVGIIRYTTQSKNITDILLQNDKLEIYHYVEVIQYFKQLPELFDKKTEEYLHMKHITGSKTLKRDWIIEKVKDICNNMVARLDSSQTNNK